MWTACDWDCIFVEYQMRSRRLTLSSWWCSSRCFSSCFRTSSLASCSLTEPQPIRSSTRTCKIGSVTCNLSPLDLAFTQRPLLVLHIFHHLLPSFELWRVVEWRQCRFPRALRSCALDHLNFSQSCRKSLACKQKKHQWNGGLTKYTLTQNICLGQDS